MSGWDLSGLDLQQSNLYGADLTDAVLTNANLTRVNLVFSNITEGQFLSGSSVMGVQLRLSVEKRLTVSSYGELIRIAENSMRNASCFVALIIGCVLSGHAIAEFHFIG